MSGQPFSCIPNGSFVYVNKCKEPGISKVSIGSRFWKRIWFPIPSWEKVVRIVGTVRHLEDVSTRECERSYKQLSDFYFSIKVSKGQIYFRAVLYYFTQRISKLQTKGEKHFTAWKLKISFTYILFDWVFFFKALICRMEFRKPNQPSCTLGLGVLVNFTIDTLADVSTILETEFHY